MDEGTDGSSMIVRKNWHRVPGWPGRVWVPRWFVPTLLVVLAALVCVAIITKVVAA